MKEREIHNILVPVDSSKTAERAFDYALQMAQLFGARIHLLYVAKAEYMSSPDYIVHTRDASDDTSPLKEKGAQVLARLMKKVPEGVEVKESLLLGVPEIMISLTAEDEEPDMIIMGTSGRNDFATMFVGSVSYYTIHHVKCPVMLIK